MTMTTESRTLSSGTAEAEDSVAEISSGVVGRGLPIGEMHIVQVDPNDPASEPEVVETVMHGSIVRDRIQIGSLLDHRLRMSEPITLDMEREDEFYIAKYDELDEFGYGTDPISAVQDFRKTIAELYWQLKEDEERLGPDLTETWQRLSALVYEV